MVSPDDFWLSETEYCHSGMKTGGGRGNRGNG